MGVLKSPGVGGANLKLSLPRPAQREAPLRGLPRCKRGQAAQPAGAGCGCAASGCRGGGAPSVPTGVRGMLLLGERIASHSLTSPAGSTRLGRLRRGAASPAGQERQPRVPSAGWLAWQGSVQLRHCSQLRSCCPCCEQWHCTHRGGQRTGRLLLEGVLLAIFTPLALGRGQQGVGLRPCRNVRAVGLGLLLRGRKDARLSLWRLKACSWERAAHVPAPAPPAGRPPSCGGRGSRRGAAAAATASSRRAGLLGGRGRVTQCQACAGADRSGDSAGRCASAPAAAPHRAPVF